MEVGVAAACSGSRRRWPRRKLASVEATWETQFRGRMRAFELRQRAGDGAFPLSIKVRATSGCFHREHSPEAYARIDEWLNSTPLDGGFALEEHESGPEFLVLAAVASGVASAVASEAIRAIVAILRARGDGIEHGDSPSDPVELIVRRAGADGVREETILRIGHYDESDHAKIDALVNDAITRIAPETTEPDH
jgi:hypothetical protein